MIILAYFLASLLICSCAALAVSSWFKHEVKTHTPVKPSWTWLPWRKDENNAR